MPPQPDTPSSLVPSTLPTHTPLSFSLFETLKKNYAPTRTTNDDDDDNKLRTRTTTNEPTTRRNRRFETQDNVPKSLVREGDGPDGNYPMRAKFEGMCRDAQVMITKAIEDIDGDATFREDCWVRANGGGGDESSHVGR